MATPKKKARSTNTSSKAKKQRVAADTPAPRRRRKALPTAVVAPTPVPAPITPLPARTFTKLQQQVIEGAKVLLRRELVFNIASNEVPSDKTIKSCGVDQAAQYLYNVTLRFNSMF